MRHPNQIGVRTLSERGRILMHQMLDQHYPPASIMRAISRATHERVSVDSIARHAKTYAKRVQSKRDARDRADHLIMDMIRHGAAISDMLRAAFHDAFTNAKKKGVLKEMDPLLLDAAERRRQDLQLRTKQFQLAERKVKVFEDRWTLDRQKAQAAVSKLDRKAREGESLTAEDVEEIRKIYGLLEEPPRDNPSRDSNPSRDRTGSPKDAASFGVSREGAVTSPDNPPQANPSRDRKGADTMPDNSQPSNPSRDANPTSPGAGVPNERFARWGGGGATDSSPRRKPWER